MPSLPPEPRITIALDGFAACGKSTLARDLCSALGYAFIDTGAMYRAVTWWLLREGCTPDPETDWMKVLAGQPFVWSTSVSGFSVGFREENLDREIRSMDVSAVVSRVAAISGIRAFLVHQQQVLGRDGGVVLDGRDIGTVVFPDAELKIFVTASEEVRVQRRFDELAARGLEVSRDKVRANLRERDRIDSTREDSPLQPSPGSLWIDTTRLDRPGQLEIALDAAGQLIAKKVGPGPVWAPDR